MGDWRQHAACIGADPELFFPPPSRSGPSRLSEARRYCNVCPVRAECRAAGLSRASSEIYGVWGGLPPKQLRRIKRAEEAAS